MRFLIILGAAALLSGCGGTTFKYSVDAATQTMPESVREKCETIEKKMVKAEGQVNSVTMADLMKSNDYMIGLYGECATRDAAKADWIKSQGQ